MVVGEYMQKYKFSIIIPVYNTEKYLEKCLDSIINQSYQNMEIIVVNDGSTDNSKDILFTYQNKYPKLINVYEKINGGLSDARNYGVSKASGDYLLFVDSDDYIESDLLLNISKNIKDDVDELNDAVPPHYRSSGHSVFSSNASFVDDIVEAIINLM